MAKGSRELLSFDDKRGRRFVSAAITPWGGFALMPYVVVSMPGTDQSRWVIDPFALLREALRLKDFPAPDVSTENGRSEEHTSELQSPCNLVCRLLLEKKKSRPLPPRKCRRLEQTECGRLTSPILRRQAM